MSDRELLELAAKAAGIELWHEDVFVNALTQKVSDNGILRWNPLTDDGDALRLAVKLGLRVQANRRAAIASGTHGTTSEKILNGGPHAATRRAIVRAAAEIGRSMA